MSGMAEVLAAHHVSHADWDESEVAVMCHCGTEIVGQDNGEEAYMQEEALYAQHLASALTTAGFGGIAEAKAEAWDEGSGSAVRAVRSGSDYPVNPYRAAAVRGEG